MLGEIDDWKGLFRLVWDYHKDRIGVSCWEVSVRKHGGYVEIETMEMERDDDGFRGSV